MRRKTKYAVRGTRPAGQTLVELLIASAVITTGMFAAATLVFSNLALIDREADEVFAVNLAREGIEEAKNVRDSNWLAGLPFDTYMYSGTDYTATPTWDGGAAGSFRVGFDFSATGITDPKAIVRQSGSAVTPSFNTQADDSAPATPFSRILIFHPICGLPGSDPTYKDDGQTCGTDPKIGVRVESRIHWTRKGTTHDTSIYEDLYDWR